MDRAATIDTTFDRQTLRVVLRALEGLLRHFEDPKVVDKTALMVSKRELHHLLSLLEEALARDAAVAVVSMAPGTWADYGMLIGYADRSVPGLSQADLEVLERLCDAFHARDTVGRSRDP